MSRIPHDPEKPRTNLVEARKAPADWLESLERSEAQLACRETVPLEPVLDLMRASIDRMEAKRAALAKK
jgi:hypothetical protein